MKTRKPNVRAEETSLLPAIQRHPARVGARRSANAAGPSRGGAGLATHSETTHQWSPELGAAIQAKPGALPALDIVQAAQPAAAREIGMPGLDLLPSGDGMFSDAAFQAKPAAAPASANLGPAIQAKPAEGAAPVVQKRDEEVPSVTEEEEEERPGFFRRLGRGILRGLGKGASAIGSAVGAVGGLAQDAVHGLAGLGTKGVAALGRGLENIGLEGAGQGLQNGAQGVRDFFRLDEDGTDFTGHVEIPDDVPEDPEQTQQYSELGLPITEDAWAMQNALDGGALERTFNETLLRALQRGGILDRLVETGAISADTIPASFAQLDEEQFKALMDAVRSQLGSGRAFLDSLEAEERESFQEEVIRRYMELAKNDEDATFMLELMPTDTAGSMGSELGGAAGDALIKGQAPHTFRVGETVGKIRQGAVNMSDVLREQGRNVYALPVPYANVRSNIIARTGVPTDGADNMHMYMQELGTDMNVVGTGYSQGGAALLDYIDRYGAEDDLDQAVVLAPMGGADREGADGVFTGERNGVETLTLMNEGDPAKEIHGDNLFELISPMLNFIADPENQRGDGTLHSGFFGDPDHPLPPNIDEITAMAAGTLGYPTHRVRPMLEELFTGGFEGKQYGRDGDFDHDLREEQPWALDIYQDGDPLPNHRVAEIDLNVLAQAIGRDQAGFEELGFDVSSEAARATAAEQIAQSIRDGLATVSAERLDEHSFRVTITVQGSRGSGQITTTWQFDDQGIFPALASAAAFNGG